jgi:replication factor A1
MSHHESESELSQHATDIHDHLPDAVALDVGPDKIEDRLSTLVSDYKVPLDEARRSVINHYLDETDTDRDEPRSENQEIELVAVDAPEQLLIRARSI